MSSSAPRALVPAVGISRHYHPSTAQFKVQLQFNASRPYPADFTSITADASFLSPLTRVAYPQGLRKFSPPPEPPS